jgi:hypothetical protein
MRNSVQLISATPRYSLHLCFPQVLPTPLLTTGTPFTSATHNAPYTYAFHRHFLHSCHFQILPTSRLSQVLPNPLPHLGNTLCIFASYRYSSHPCFQVLPMSSAPWYSCATGKLKYSRNPCASDAPRYSLYLCCSSVLPVPLLIFCTSANPCHSATPR